MALTTFPARFPLLRRPTTLHDGLQPGTQQLLDAHALRFRVQMPAQATPVLHAYLPHVHGIDVLLAIWHLAAQHGEHRRVFAQGGQSPSLFVTLASSTELLVVAEEGAAWTTGEGVYGLSSVDDCVEGARGRLHAYVLPAYRTPRFSGLVGAMALDYLFRTRQYHLLYCLVPAPNHLAVRYAQRLGFQRHAVWPDAVYYDGGITDAVHLSMTQWQWERHYVDGR